VIVIDGKFKYFEDDHDISIDNSREVVEKQSYPIGYRLIPYNEKWINFEYRDDIQELLAKLTSTVIIFLSAPGVYDLCSTLTPGEF
jgi:hypothetical protein